MPPSKDHSVTAASTIARLLGAFRSGEIDVERFCSAYETAYNFEVDRTSLSAVQGDAAELLFNKVVWFSPFADERAKVPQYICPSEVSTAVEAAWSAFAT